MKKKTFIEKCIFFFTQNILFTFYFIHGDIEKSAFLMVINVWFNCAEVHVFDCHYHFWFTLYTTKDHKCNTNT